MQIRTDIPTPPARRGAIAPHEPIVGAGAALDALAIGACLEVGEPTSRQWGYQRAHEAALRGAAEGRAYRASRGAWGWRIWRVR